jgi:hypothetical protein
MSASGIFGNMSASRHSDYFEVIRENAYANAACIAASFMGTAIAIFLSCGIIQGPMLRFWKCFRRKNG